jgi:hypothetical protein
LKVVGVRCIVRAVDARVVIAELSRTFAARNWRAMEALYHPDALILTVTGGPEPLRAGEVIAELERASDDIWYSVSAEAPVVLDEHAVVVVGRMRRTVQRRGFEDASHVWLLTVVDGLIYRQGVFLRPEEAVDAYRSLGVSLGLTSGLEPDRATPGA